MFGFGNKHKKQEEELANWLAHPSEFGCAPRSIKHLRAYPLNLMAFGPTEVHLIGYEMPDGTRGRGFVNPITWSFLGDGVNQIPDDKLIKAYCGWAFLFPALQEGRIESNFVSDGEEQKYLTSLAMKGLQDVEIQERYRIGTSEIYGFRATYQGKAVRGAGNTGSEVGYGESQPEFQLPAVYFLLGQQVIQ